MTSAILSTIHQPATAVITAVAMHPKPDDFCKELALRGLNDGGIVAVVILNHSQNAELQIVGSYGPKIVLDLANDLINEIEAATREKNQASLRVVKVGQPEVPVRSAFLVPSTPMTVSSGVIAIFYSEERSPDVFEVSTQIALAFACEMYCSPNWGSGVGTSIRSKRGSQTGEGEARLTTRQKAVLEYMAEGRTNDRIARLLNYSVATVKNDISSIFQYLGVSNRHDAIAEAANRSLLPPPPQLRNKQLSAL